MASRPTITCAPHHSDECRRVLAMKISDRLLLDARRRKGDDTYDRGYRVRPSGVVYADFDEKDNELRRLPDRRVSYAPLWLSGQGVDVDSGKHYLELAFTRARDATPQLHTLLVERGAALNARKLIDFADAGLPVASPLSTAVASYLAKLEAAIGPYIATDRLTERNGWHDVDGARSFVLADRCITREDDHAATRVRLYPRNHGEEATVRRGLSAAGDHDEWLDVARKARDSSDLARFILAAGFAAPLLRLCGARSFGVHVYGDSGGGKTAIAKLVSSIFGDPSRLISTLFTTIVGVERKAALFCDLPIVLDELQLNADVQMRKTLSYLIAQETGKTRGAKEGGLQQTARWRVVALTTGEEPLTTLDDFGGQSARMLELNGRPVEDDALATRMHDVTGRCYGHAGRAFLEALVNADAARVRDALGVGLTRLRKELPDARPSSLTALATVCWADALADVWVFGAEESGSAFLDESIEMGRRIWSREPSNAPYGVRAMEWVRSWLVTNRRHFVREVDYGPDTQDAPPENETVWGKITQAGDAYILHNVWDQEATRAGYNPTRVLQDWRDRGWIETEGGHLKPRRHIVGRRTRVVALKGPALEPSAQPEREAGRLEAV